MAHSNESRELFTSAKTQSPIPIEGSVFRDALIRASLDPAVRSIEKMSGSVLVRNLAVVLRDDGRFAYGLDGDARLMTSFSPLAFEESRLRPLTLTMQELYCEPAISNHRLIWSHKARRVSNGIRTQILELLAGCGHVPLGELVSTLRIQRRSETSLLSMACADLIEIGELAVKPLGPDSIVRRRSASGTNTKVFTVAPVALRTAWLSGGERFSTHNLMIKPR
ncbi:hypothetical protein ACFQX9_22500 [Bradyrhizobium sp. GCM10028915]|uniref:hypothetical protein n=1 Tax=Bradyrhizobium sp. GCM10028915 TaxID=3273385 RepID=UPI003606B6F1